MSTRKIEIFVDLPELQWDESEIQTCIRNIVSLLGNKLPDGDLSIAILSDAKIAELHEDFLQDPSETDVITFPGDQKMEFAGEICVSADRALATCDSHLTSFAEELTLYIAHGLLHLAGYNDKTDEQCVEMRKGEKWVMDHLKKLGAVPSFSFNPGPLIS